MPQKLKVELQDENGNVYYLHTAADVVFLDHCGGRPGSQGDKIWWRYRRYGGLRH